MSWAERTLVVDANILIRAVLGQRVYDLIDNYAGDVELFTPQACYDDALRYLPVIAASRGFEAAPLLASLQNLRSLVWSVAAETYEPLRDNALLRIERRDPDDLTVLATALVLRCPIWTEDRDFFGVGVPTWTTDRVEIYLDGAA